MAFFYPTEIETRLVPLSKEQLYQSLEKHIKPIKGEYTEAESSDHLFVGNWSENGFSVSIKLKISNSFVPLIDGTIITSDEGILIRLSYDFFPSTKKLLLFWTIITLFITVFFIVFYQAWLYGAISFGLCLVNYILSRENFKLQVRKSKRMLSKMLS